MTEVLTDGDEQNLTEKMEKSKHPDGCPPKVSETTGKREWLLWQPQRTAIGTGQFL